MEARIRRSGWRFLPWGPPARPGLQPRLPAFPAFPAGDRSRPGGARQLGGIGAPDPPSGSAGQRRTRTGSGTSGDSDAGEHWRSVPGRGGHQPGTITAAGSPALEADPAADRGPASRSLEAAGHPPPGSAASSAAAFGCCCRSPSKAGLGAALQVGGRRGSGVRCSSPALLGGCRIGGGAGLHQVGSTWREGQEAARGLENPSRAVAGRRPSADAQRAIRQGAPAGEGAPAALHPPNPPSGVGCDGLAIRRQQDRPRVRQNASAAAGAIQQGSCAAEQQVARFLLHPFIEASSTPPLPAMPGELGGGGVRAPGNRGSQPTPGGVHRSQRRRHQGAPPPARRPAWPGALRCEGMRIGTPSGGEGWPRPGRPASCFCRQPIGGLGGHQRPAQREGSGRPAAPSTDSRGDCDRPARSCGKHGRGPCNSARGTIEGLGGQPAASRSSRPVVRRRSAGGRRGRF